MEILINIWAVAAAAVAAFFVGMVWYSPLLFSKQWMKEIGLEMPNPLPTMSSMAPQMGVSLVVQFVTAFVLAHVAVAFGASGWSGALQLGLWMWVGFYAPTVLSPVLWEKRSLTWYAITAGHLLVVSVLMSVIIVLWK